MKKYVIASLEIHLFFGRIMKEHALFLLAGFPEKETEYRKKADWFREQFEDVLESAVRLGDGIVGRAVLDSGEIVTEFTEMAERKTECLTGIPIDVQITQAEKRLRAASTQVMVSQKMVQQVRRLNQRALWLLNGLIDFKEKILREMLSCDLYTSNYPLLIEHILREAKLYRQTVMELERNGCTASRDLKSSELFWNQIMMEHAQFIRGLLDPTECELIEAADGFADDYCRLLEEARKQDCRAMEELTQRTRETTEKYRAFKTAGTKGITGCEIRSVILPLLADHVLREANHYLRILEHAGKGRD
ncbi:MAG: DUF2935 domain-containing protein [Lachnospiraceae bacterium]|nr:DUF2935 domain-containing protein [Lachnospiraceae bacterium]